MQRLYMCIAVISLSYLFDVPFNSIHAQTIFSDVSAAAGVDESGISGGVAWGDYDNDNDLDLFFTKNDGINRLFQNNGDGTFAERGVEANVNIELNGHEGTAAWADFDNDGDIDLFRGKTDGSNLLLTLSR